MLLAQVISYLLTFTAGMADGGAESLKWHYDVVDAKYNLSDAYWNPKVSYLNKYAGGVSSNGPRFPGSTTYLVWTTDGYHALRAVRNVSIVAAIVIHPKKKKKWWKYVIEGASYYATYNAGFYLSYEVIAK